MSFRILVALVVVLGLTGCATRLNPFNWFGGDREQRISAREAAEAEAAAAEVDPRLLVAEVLSLNVDALPTGAIVRAVGLPPRQGYWEADLVLTEVGDRELVFEFRVFEPLDPDTRVGPPHAREIHAATSLSRQDLAGIRSIVVVAQQNRRSVSRN
jgi:hypothetical protein